MLGLRVRSCRTNTYSLAISRLIFSRSHTPHDLGNGVLLTDHCPVYNILDDDEQLAVLVALGRQTGLS